MSPRSATSGSSATMRNDRTTREVTSIVCMRKGFNCLRTGKASPIAEWLRALCRYIHNECGGPGLSVIGMCFTGGFVLTLMADSSVIAPVAAQPALPFLHPAALDIDAETLAKAAARPEHAPLLGVRFAEDALCREEAVRYNTA